MFKPLDDDGRYDFDQLNKELDRAKSKVFIRPDSAFYGPLMCSLNFIWTESLETAGTDGVNFYWNPADFINEPPARRASTIVHELKHCAHLHMLRIGNRDPKMWNYACDIFINRTLVEANWEIGPEWVQCHPEIKATAEEDIYKHLTTIPPPPPQGGGGARLMGDIIPAPGDKNKAIGNVVKAIQSAKQAGKPGSIPGNSEMIVEQFLSPVIPWERLLAQWFTDLMEEDYTWARPNRRYADMYLPSRFQDEGRLEHLVYFQDVSGSIGDAEIVRFNSELKYVWDKLKPLKMTVVQFDTKIQKIDEYKDGEPFTKIRIVGRGGTCLICVRQLIIDLKPTAAVIFTDLEVSPMRPIQPEIPILWIGVNAGKKSVPFGKLIHIKV